MTQEVKTLTYEEITNAFTKAMERLTQLELVWSEISPIVSKLRQVVYQEIDPTKVSGGELDLEQFKADTTMWLQKFNKEETND